MGSIPNPRTWIPYGSAKDCSQRFCSFHCPKWCYIIFPPPPRFDFPDDRDSSTNFSPLVIAIIGILGSAFLLVSYYAIISKYCRNRESTSGRQNHVPSRELEENRDPSNHGPWLVFGNGLDESLIKTITMFKYRKEDGILEGTDCSVCLGEFQEDESLRLLPKCSHAFHAACIDPWLKSHSNCPLCRANIVSINGSPPPVMDGSPEDDSVESADGIEIGLGQQEIAQSDAPMTLERAPNVVQNSENRSRLIDVGADEEHHVRRSLSMDNPRRVSSDDEDSRIEDCEIQGNVGPSKGKAGETSNRNNLLHCITRPTGMTRSFSSGRFTFANRERERDTILPF